MLNRNHFTYVYGDTSEQWAKRYGLEPFAHPCGECSRTLTTSQPFAYGRLRGLSAPPCVCGNKSTPYCVVAVRGDILDGEPLAGTPSKQRNARSPR